MVRHPVVAAVTYIVWNFALQPQVFLQVQLSYLYAMSLTANITVTVALCEGTIWWNRKRDIPFDSLAMACFDGVVYADLSLLSSSCKH